MFTEPNLNVIESDEGFAVEVLGRTGMRYRERDRTLHLYSEVSAGPEGLAIYRSSIRHWDHPHEEELVDDDTRSRIIDNIRRAFQFKGFDIAVI